MSKGTQGTKYAATKDLSRVEIAKLIRADIKAAVKAGTLPKGKYSVRCERYAGGGSIDVEVSDLAVQRVFDLDACAERERTIYSPELQEVIEHLEAIHDAYNYDNSDSMTDYFDVRYYGNVRVSSDWARAARDAEEAAGLEALRLASESLAVEMEALLASAELGLADTVPAPSAQADFLAYLGA